MNDSWSRQNLGPSLKRNSDHEEIICTSAAPLVCALAGETALRDPESVRHSLDWWLQSLPSLGVQLAPELETPGKELFQAFSRGRLVSFSKGERLQAEGEEVRHYAIVLVGRLRLRSRAPPPKPRAAPEVTKDALGESTATLLRELEDETTALDEDGFVHVGCVGRGEALGLVGEPRAPWDALAAEPTAVLLLGADDYAATLRPFHRWLHAETVGFLQSRNICPQATTTMLQKLAPLLRRRRVLRGAVISIAGELQRSISIIQEGSFSLFAPPHTDSTAEGDDEAEKELERADQDIELEVQRRERLRESKCGAAKQRQAAADEARNTAIQGYARGHLGKIIRGEKGTRPMVLGGTTRKDGLLPVAVLSEPGSVIGEETLLYDSFRDFITARSCHTIVAEENGALLVADITAFQKLGSCMGIDTLVEKTRERVNRYLGHYGNSRRTASRLTKEKRRIQQREIHKQERQLLRLPPSYLGAAPLAALESTDDWLTEVLMYRKAPRNDKNPGTLQCLTTMGFDPLTFNRGPGVGAMLQVFNNPSELKTLRETLRFGKKMPGRRMNGDRNPMGEFVQKDARYLEAAIPTAADTLDALAIANETAEAVEHTSSVDVGADAGGSFFCTELDEELVPSPPVVKRVAEPQSNTALRSASRDSLSQVALPQARRCSSVPALPRLGCSERSARTENPNAASTMPQRRVGSGSGSGAGSRNRKGGGCTREAVITKTFYRTVVGKSMLVLTDKAETRKSMGRGLQTCLTDFELMFVKSTIDLWTRLNNTKEIFHVLIVDMAKTELQIERLLKTVRQHKRYGRIPILVISADRELPEVVRTSCSFVVFHPISAQTLREGLLWCLDRQALQNKGAQDSPELKPSEQAQQERHLIGMPDDGLSAVSLTAVAI